MDKILCPIDFSEVSLNALEFAVALGEKEKSEVTLLNIFTPADFNAILKSDHVKKEYNQLLELADSKLNAICKEVEKISKKKGLVACQPQLVSGKITDTIADVTAKEKYGLVVLGTRGHSAYDKKYLRQKA